MSREFKSGLNSGIPIGLGYLSVSFTFGIFAVTSGLYWWQALIISMITVTSAGQLSGVNTMLIPGQYLSMLLSQITINMRYSFMSMSLSQKADSHFTVAKRWLYGFFVTDEIFAVANMQDKLSPTFFKGLCVWPWLGWSFGTLLGALMGSVLSPTLLSAMSLGLYAMFIAIVVPEAKRNLKILLVIILASAISCSFTYVPMLASVPGGISITITAFITATVAALLFPIESKNQE